MSEDVNAPVNGAPEPDRSAEREELANPEHAPVEPAASEDVPPDEEADTAASMASPSEDAADLPAEEEDNVVAESDDSVADEEEDSTNGEPVGADSGSKQWYVVKVQSGREDTIKEAIERRVRKEGLEPFFGQIVIPVEKYTEIKTDKNGKRVTRTKERKLYPGYLMVEVEYNDRILYLFRETSGVGDFVGAHPGDLMRPPTPMTDREVQRMIGVPGKPGAKDEPVSPKPKWLQEGDRVRVVDGTFNGMEGMVKQILESISKVQVELTIFGRPVAVELEYYQVEQL